MKELAYKIVSDAIADYHSQDRNVHGTVEIFTICVNLSIESREECMTSIFKGENIAEIVKYVISDIRKHIRESLNDGVTKAQILSILSIAHPMYKRADHMPTVAEWELIESGLISWWTEVYCA